MPINDEALQDAIQDQAGKYPVPTSPEYHFLVRELVALISANAADVLEEGYDLTLEEAAQVEIAMRLTRIIFPTSGKAH